MAPIMNEVVDLFNLMDADELAAFEGSEGSWPVDGIDGTNFPSYFNGSEGLIVPPSTQAGGALDFGTWLDLNRHLFTPGDAPVITNGGMISPTSMIGTGNVTEPSMALNSGAQTAPFDPNFGLVPIDEEKQAAKESEEEKERCLAHWFGQDLGLSSWEVRNTNKIRARLAGVPWPYESQVMEEVITAATRHRVEVMPLLVLTACNESGEIRPEVAGDRVESRANIERLMLALQNAIRDRRCRQAQVRAGSAATRSGQTQNLYLEGIAAAPERTSAVPPPSAPLPPRPASPSAPALTTPILPTPPCELAPMEVLEGESLGEFLDRLGNDFPPHGNDFDWDQAYLNGEVGLE